MNLYYLRIGNDAFVISASFDVMKGAVTVVSSRNVRLAAGFTEDDVRRIQTFLAENGVRCEVVPIRQ